MGFRHNNVLPANHFRKDWQRRVKTWFNQPGRKLRRRNARKAKAAALGVRPLSLLRPAVRAPTVRYNIKLREGRGFTLAELKEAGIGRKAARGVGIVVDHRRRNLSEEGKALNVARLKEYKTRLVVFPRVTKKPKTGDCTGADLEAPTTRAALPLPPSHVHEAPRKITAEEREFKAYRALREGRSTARYEGIRKIRKAKVRTTQTCCISLLTPCVEGRGGGQQEEVNLVRAFIFQDASSDAYVSDPAHRASVVGAASLGSSHLLPDGPKPSFSCLLPCIFAARQNHAHMQSLPTETCNSMTSELSESECAITNVCKLNRNRA